MIQCRQGIMLDTNEELYKWFTHHVMKNLHVVFTMNPSSDGLKDRAATSLTLFNQCVLNWFGDWSDNAFFQVGKEFTINMDLDHPSWSTPDISLRLYNEKRSGLEVEQLHINVGLNKIAETVPQLEEMQKSLTVKSSELQSKNEEALD